MSPEQVAQVLYQAGFRGQALVNMLAIGKRESEYQASAHRTDTPGQQRTGDFGLFQINYVNVPGLVSAGIIQNAVDLLNPVKNAQAAFHLSGGGTNLSPWAAASGGWTAGGDPFYRTDRTAAATAVQNAQTQGLLGADYAGTGANTTGGGSVPASNTAATASGPMTLPSDARLINNGFTVIAVFDIGGVSIGYDMNWFDGSVTFDPNAVEHMTSDQYVQLGIVNGGNAEELRDMNTQGFGSYKDYFDRILNEVMGFNNPARNDAEVLKVLAEFAGRPDMQPAELTNRLQATKWYQDRTTDELTWNSLPGAEQDKRKVEMAAKMVATWFQFTGEVVSADDPRVVNYLQDLSSGKMGYGAFTENIVKTSATNNDESPWARSIREEQEAQRQRGVDTENTAQRIQGLAQRWGLRWSNAEYQRWAQQIVEKTSSEADLIEIMKDQATVLFPWKDREMETATAAAPWMSTMERVLERPGDMFDPRVQRSLGAGQSVWDFEQSLRQGDEWLGTKNARESMYETVSEVGRRMGFE